MPRRKKAEPLELHPQVMQGIITIVCIAVAFFLLLSYLGKAGQAGILVDRVTGVLLGTLRFALPLVVLVVGIFVHRADVGLKRLIPLGILFITLLGLLHLRVSPEPTLQALASGGGYLGFLIAVMLKNIMGFQATVLVLITVALIAFVMLFEVSLVFLLHGIIASLRSIWGFLAQEFRRVPKTSSMTPKEAIEETPSSPPLVHTDFNAAPTEDPEDETAAESPEQKTTPLLPPPMPVRRAALTAPVSLTLPSYAIPLDLLDDRTETPVSGDVAANEIRIQQTFEHFGIPIEMSTTEVGPTVTRYTFKPAEGIKLSRITTLGSDLSLALAAHPIRIEAPIPGKSLVGLEVPNRSIARVTLRDILGSPEWLQRDSQLSLALGKDVAGGVILSDLKRMPHLLVAGATGSGKTVGLNVMIMSLLYANSPATCRLLLIDPKRVELTVYNGIPHLVIPVVTDVKKTIQALRYVIAEMDRRFELFQEQGARDITSYNSKAQSGTLPYLVVVIDELADLMAVAASEVEGLIIRIAQMARATGIHLIVATQRPSVDVITGLIKANIPARIAFSVASAVDSRTILDTMGAEKLLGRGDMLCTSPELQKPRRVQGAFVSEDEIKSVVAHIIKNVPPLPTPEDTSLEGSRTNGSPEVSLDEYQGENEEDNDPLYEEAKRVVVEMQKASATLLQRRLKVGYARAARLLDLLELKGVVGKGVGAKPREIMVQGKDILEANPFNTTQNDTAPPLAE